jgi:hypothetical protein
VWWPATHVDRRRRPCRCRGRHRAASGEHLTAVGDSQRRTRWWSIGSGQSVLPARAAPSHRAAGDRSSGRPIRRTGSLWAMPRPQ